MPLPSDRLRRWSVLLALGGSAWAAPASANGRFPASNEITFSAGDPSRIVVRTTYGILLSQDAGATWTYLCEDALGLPANNVQDPELGLTANGTLVAGLSDPTVGLERSSDLGCNWNCVGGPLAGQPVVDLVIAPQAQNTVLALVSTPLPDDAGSGMRTQVLESVDNGANWAALGAPLDPTVIVQTIDVAAADSQRIYVSATRGYGVDRTASLFVSTDLGGTWTEQPLAGFDPTMESAIFIGGVDPTDADRVYLRSSALVLGGESRLFVTRDRGQSFDVVQSFIVPSQPVAATNGEILGFALSPDGGKVYAGTTEDGLFVADSTDLAFHNTSAIHVQCLAARGTELWACSDEASGFVVGVSSDDGASFRPAVPSLTGVQGPIACAPSAGPFACGATSNGSVCSSAFDNLCQMYGCAHDAGTEGPEAGTGQKPIDAGLPDGGSKPPSESSGCGIGNRWDLGTRGRAGAGLTLALAAILTLTRRRRARVTSAGHPPESRGTCGPHRRGPLP